ncbi:MAG TPA: phenylalanine--tRNA ligase subunit alpha [Thermomicrobiales bacterium]|nr:phenylalanine--tRNA ligase subunit alpha [Thermomicrobiales bacterium]
MIDFTTDELLNRALTALEDAQTEEELTRWHRAVLGRSGTLNDALRALGSLPSEQRRERGQQLNGVKDQLEAAFAQRQDLARAAALDSRLRAESVDVTLPGRRQAVGNLHPIAAMAREVSDIFAHLGFQTIEGPEVELAEYSFDMLNIPKDHPARDVWDTIFIRSAGTEITLRPHTSPMQIRTMLQQEPPVRVIVPGRTYRYEAQDATHEWHFHQVEGLAVDRNITMADLRGTMAEFARQIFGSERKVRFRCDYFPFVEPGVDMSIDCPFCAGRGCRTCKQSGWIEISGAGMVHPNVLTNVGYDPTVYSGWAFGMGLDRLVMLKYNVQDIRLLYANDLRFLGQFNRARL